MAYWLGIDPGGEGKFGLAKLQSDGSFETARVSSVHEAVDLVDEQPFGVGIDCLLWWSADRSGVRQADKWIRKTYGIHSRNVQSVNSMWGAVLVQGILFAMQIRQRFPHVEITEVHPKALLVALLLKSDAAIKERFQVHGEWATEDERDAVIAATSAREGFSGTWQLDLTSARGALELDPSDLWFGAVHYWWPHHGL